MADYTKTEPSSGIATCWHHFGRKGDVAMVCRARLQSLSMARIWMTFNGRCRTSGSATVAWPASETSTRAPGTSCARSLRRVAFSNDVGKTLLVDQLKIM
eukprot:scaffold250043_cov16-Prasinocladus_malaysianus.AAC.1